MQCQNNKHSKQNFLGILFTKDDQVLYHSLRRIFDLALQGKFCIVLQVTGRWTSNFDGFVIQIK